MIPKISKCQAMAIKSSTGKVYDPALHLDGKRLPFTGSQPVKFLGGNINISHRPKQARKQLHDKLTSLLDRVNTTLVTRKQKLRLYKLGICPRLSWDLTINSFPLSWIEKVLDPIVTRYLKQWSGLAKSADPSRLFLPNSLGGLEFSNVSGLYRILQSGKAALLMASRDREVQYSTRIQVQKETIALRSKFKPYLFAQEIFSQDPGISRKALSKRVKNSMKQCEASEYLAHAKDLPVQGKLFQLVDQEATLIWSKAVQTLPPNKLKFILNAAQDSYIAT